MSKTISAKAQEIERKWFVIDASNKVVGRVAEKAAVILRGKHKPTFTTHVDTGDFVVVINAAKAIFTGKKETAKEYTSFSGFMGGHKSENPQRRRARRP
ncbi:MAG TPA: 50S ribosomal protein L13, partial [Candidatus Methylacidiphilales bacterium]